MSKHTRPQAEVLRKQRSFGDRIRDWLHDREIAAGKRRAEAKKTAAAASNGARGVDRVPARLRVVAPDPTWVHQHTPTRHPVTGRWVKGTPYRNPGRVGRLARSGRLRRDLP